MKRSFNNATIFTRFKETVDICSIVDDVEGGEFKVINKTIDASGPPNTRSLDGLLTGAQSASSKLPKVADLKDDEAQIWKQAYRQIQLDCDRGNIEKVPQHGTAFCVRKWNGQEDRAGRFIEPPVLDQGTYIHRDTDEYLMTSDWEGGGPR